MAVNWSKLKENSQGKGFEALAIDYLKSNFKGKWEQTQQTRDGNRDAFTIIFLDKEAWAEAKYTLKPQLSRYRLDATIVSAIINKNKVIEIIFITNSQISNGTKKDIKTALNNAIGAEFQSVHFKTKLDIEFWLFNNPYKYEQYFDDKRDSLLELKFGSIVTDDIAFYNLTRQTIYFREPLKELYLHENYLMTFSFFSIEEKKNSNIIITNDLIELSPQTLELKKGDNHFEFEIRCIKTGILSDCLFLFDETEVKITSSVSIKYQHLWLNIESQTNIHARISASFLDFCSNDHSKIHIIKGKEGTGKSELIQRILREPLFRTYDIIYQSFTIDNVDSSILLVNIVLSIYFYYSDYSSIDESYLKKLFGHSFVNSYLTDLVVSKNRFEKNKTEESIKKFREKISEYSTSKELFPSFLELNKKVIILDDLHKLDDVSVLFLLNLITEIKESKINCFIILCGRKSFVESEAYQRFSQENLIESHDYVLESKDVYNNIISAGFEIDPKMLSLLTNRIALNIFFTKSLILFIQKESFLFSSGNIESKHLAINSFISSEIYKENILNSFNSVSEIQMDLLRIVYFSISGIDSDAIRKAYLSDVDKLESLQYIKYDNKKISPFHDLYQEIFKSNYQPTTFETFARYIKYKPSKYEKYRHYLAFYKSVSKEDKLVLLDIEKLFKDQKFHTILYILEPLFTKVIQDEIHSVEWQRRRFDDCFYYNLMFYYGYATGNCNKITGGKEIFQKIYLETKDLYHPDIRKNLIKVLGELINSSFEHLALDDIDTYSGELKKLLEELRVEGFVTQKQIEKDRWYLLMLHIDILRYLLADKVSEAHAHYKVYEELCTKNDKTEMLMSLNIRFARSLYHTDINYAYNLICSSIDELVTKTPNQKKWILIGQMEKEFIEIQRQIPGATLKKMYKIHDALREDFFNDYNKGNLIIASCCIFLGLKDKAYIYLYKDYFIKRKARPKIMGVRLHLLSIYEYKYNDNAANAIANIEQQMILYQHLGETYKNVMQHNLNLIKGSKNQNINIDFYNKKEFLPDTLYIDPRIW